MSHLPVLIVGAGPTGLMMANELERHNIPFRIIDFADLRILGLYLLVSCRHELHETFGSNPALGVRVEITFRHGLCFKDLPIEAHSKVLL